MSRVLALILLVLLGQSAVSFADYCPSPKSLAHQIIKHEIDGLEYFFAKDNCFNKKRYKNILAEKKLEDTPMQPLNVVAVDNKKPYKISGIVPHEDLDNNHLKKYDLHVTFYEWKTRKPVRAKLTFWMDKKQKYESIKKHGCARFNDFEIQPVLAKCLKKEYRKRYAEANFKKKPKKSKKSKK